jgi:uncharacterized protein (TIGR03435 family)
LITAVAIFSAGVSTAQQPQPAHFEAAAIRPGTPQQGMDFGTSGGVPGGQYRITNMPLRQWVKMGLSVQDYALKAPSWLDTARFDLNAKMPNQPVTKTSIAEMMRSLLVERFGLQWHEEQQTVSGFELVQDKKVLAQPASLLERLRAPTWGNGPTLINGTNLPMSKLAELLGSALGRPVADATHLSGGYDIKLNWRPDSDAEVAQMRQYGKQYGIDVDNLPGSASTAVREQLGLRLQPAKVPSKVIVVDHINAQPSAN